MLNELLMSFIDKAVEHSTDDKAAASETARAAASETARAAEEHFQLPIAFLEQKTALEEHTVNDLELRPADPTKSLYKYVLKPDTIFGEKTMPLWSRYYTPDTAFLQESQKLLKFKLQTGGEFTVTGEKQTEVQAIWDEIQGETGFHEKYSYLDWGPLKFLNNNSKFLQCLSMYNMSSPVFSLAMPVFFLILPLIIIKLRGLPISIEKYIELLKVVFKKHQLGQMFDLSKASFERIMYVVVSVVFYVIQIYQNIMSCRRFYKNMSKIHEQLFTMRDYLKCTIKNMDILKTQCVGFKTYEPFIDEMVQHQKVCQLVLTQYSKVGPAKASIKKIWQIGHVMKCFYHLYENKNFHATLQYSFGLNGYIDNLNGLRFNIALKNMNVCKFTKQSNTNKQSNNKPSKAKPCKFTQAYFPSLVDENPVKNTYTLDKHLIITGPNAAGKTTLLKTTIFNIILSQQVGYGFYKKATLTPYDMIHCYINIPDTSARDSLFQAEAKRCKDILVKISAGAAANEAANEVANEAANEVANEAANEVAGAAAASHLRHFCVFDELYSGTNPYEAISSAYAYLTYLNKHDNVNFVLTTHFLDLCRRLDKEKNIHNCHMKIETVNDDFKYTYKLEKGISDIKGGIKVLRDLEYPDEIIKMTSTILQELQI
jgi:ABC-type branched-subunit amino acid transport system ATPase component